MTEPLTLRAAVPADVEAMADLCARAVRRAYAGLVTPDYVERIVAHWFGVGRLRRELAPAPRWFGFVVATRGPAVLGMAGSGLGDGGHAELYTLYVDPVWQRGGVGRALIAHEIERARGAGVAWLDVAVLPGNAPAIAFYEACGFVRGDDRPIYAPHGQEGGPDVAVIYRRAL